MIKAVANFTRLKYSRHSTILKTKQIIGLIIFVLCFRIFLEIYVIKIEIFQLKKILPRETHNATPYVVGIANNL